MKKVLFVVAAAALMLSAAVGVDQAQLAKIGPRLKQFVDAGQGPGMVTLVARNGEIVALDSVGYFDAETKKPMPKDAIFQIHSMTKPVVAIGVMQLMEDGMVGLNDAIEKHLPEFRGQMVIESREADGSVRLKKPARPVTIRDLMTHTSGMPLNPPPGIGELHGALHKTLAEVVLVLSQRPLEFEPGTKWSYSNTGIATLARLIEVKSGMAFEKYLEVKIFKPLGMNDSYIFPPKEKWGRMPTAYILKDGVPVKYTMDPLGEGAMKFRAGAKYSLPEGGIYSTATDLFALYQAMLNKGTYKGAKILSPSSVDLMTKIHTGTLKTGNADGGWGLGWSVMSDGSYGHGGRYGTYCLIDPAKKAIYIFMIHREGGSDERNAFVQIAQAAWTD